MTEKEITKRFLWLFSKNQNHPAAHQGFRELRELVPSHGQWPEIVDARLMALEKKTEESIALLKEILAREPRNFCASLLLASILCFENDQPKEGINIYDSMLQQGFENQTLPDWLQAFTLFKKAVALGQVGRTQEAIRVYDEVVERFGQSADLILREQAVQALYNKGWTLVQMGRAGEAIRVYDEVLQRFGESAELTLQDQVAKALCNKGGTLKQMGNSEEAIRVFDDVVQRFGESADLPLQDHVAKALVNKGATLGQMDNSEEAIRVADEVLERFGESADLTLREQVAHALYNKGVTLDQMGRYEDAIRVYDDVVQRFGESGDLPLRDQVAQALYNKVVALQEIGKSEEAIRVCDDVLERFGELADLTLLAQVAKALYNKVLALGEMGKSEEAIRVCDDLLERFGESADLTLRAQVAKALYNKAWTLGQTGKSEATIRLCDDLIHRFGESADLSLLDQVARAVLEKGVTLGQMGKYEEAIRVYDDLVQRFGESADISLRDHVAKALYNKAWTLGHTGKSEEAIRVCDDLVHRFGESSDITLRGLVAKSVLYKAESLLDIDRVDEARALLTLVETEYLGSEELRSQLASYYAYLHLRFAATGGPEEEEQAAERTETALDITRKDLASNLRVYLTLVLQHVAPEKQEEYFKKIEDAEERIGGFIRDDSQFSSDVSFLLVLREWNSYTPVIPRQEESDRGGGYFIRHAEEGIVIDPGYDFIENFYRAGGLLCDIDHVIVTHAHDDHTAELEALLMLFHRRWTSKEWPSRKRVSLYLGAGVQRKFTGLLNLRDPKYKRIVTLYAAGKGFEQRVSLNSRTELTVLPAYHDDVITQNSAVGLGFEFATKWGQRKVVFTGDSGLYSVKLGDDGKKKLYDNNEDTPMLDVAEGKALYEVYPEKFHKPDLLVAHIGSIKKSEFLPHEAVRSREDEGRWYYVNHLGLLGTLTMLHQLNPEAAVISEFGSELKGFHFDLVDKLGQALHDRQHYDSPDERMTFVIPGDLTIAYDIANHRFLCHDTCEFADPAHLYCRQAAEYVPEIDVTTQTYDPKSKGNATRTYLFNRKRDAVEDDRLDNISAKGYCRKLFDRELPYHKK
jgi:tetratricopeptide (TPR) repeat protein